MNLGSSHLYESNELQALSCVEEWDAETYCSPQLDEDSLPSGEGIFGMLNQDSPTILQWPFNRYNEALKINKQKAKEVLRELSTAQ